MGGVFALARVRRRGDWPEPGQTGDQPAPKSQIGEETSGVCGAQTHSLLCRYTSARFANISFNYTHKGIPKFRPLERIRTADESHTRRLWF